MMAFKSLFLVLVGSALVLAFPSFEGDEGSSKIGDGRDIIEVDEANPSEPQEPFGEVTEELPSFSTLPPTPEPPVVEQELPEDQAEITTAGGKPDIKEKVGQWLEGVGEKVKEHVEDDKKIITDTWETLKNHWNKWYVHGGM